MRMYWFCYFKKIRRKYKRICLLFIPIIYLYWTSREKDSKQRNTSTYETDDILYSVLRNYALHRDQRCVHPRLDPYHASVSKFFHNVPDLNCSEEPDWITVQNGTFWISKHARASHSHISCQYAPMFRGADDYKIKSGGRVTFEDGIITSPSDFFKVACKSQDGGKYFNVHTTISNKVHLSQHQRQSNSNISMPLNVLMFGFDSVSRNTWLRKLPHSHKYFTEDLGGILLNGYNIIGDGTPQALLPILTGNTESELPESRRGKPGAKTLDNHPWIWRDFKKSGYVTHWAEDMAHIGTFNLRMLGFAKPPVDHYARPFYLAAQKINKFNKKYCLGSVPRHQVMMNWIKESFLKYPNRLKFIFGFHSEYSHTDSNNLQWADQSLLDLLKFLKTGEYLNETILVLMSDHGARFHDIRQTIQGKYEERMPYFAFRFPTWFPDKYPEAYKHFKKNSERLTTPFDIHETFHDILRFDNRRQENRSKYGISLFRHIPIDRSCLSAGISSHWCACLRWNDTSVTDPIVQHAAVAAVNYINALTKKFRQKCQILVLKNISSAMSLKTNPNIVRYKGSSDKHGRVAVESKTNVTQDILYQITFVTNPGGSIFEATLRYITKRNKIVLNEKDISRINRYGNTANCILNEAPHLRPYCQCVT